MKLSAIVSQKVSSLIPIEEIEDEAVKQLEKAGLRDFIKRLAVMPDIHAGYDLPIGTVALTDNIISPSFVGYDIGCGMCQVKLGESAQEVLAQSGGAEEVRRRIHAEVPVGFSSLRKRVHYPEFVSALDDRGFSKGVQEKLESQLGTLGGGNHFIEFGENKGGEAFITIHSGSRNSGHKIAEAYMKRGHYLELDSDLGRAYHHDMEFMLEYALANRLEIMRKIVTQVFKFDEGSWKGKVLPTLINENHNHALLVEGGVLHRKGATAAEAGQMGVIPGNMRDGVYVTRGLGNGDFLASASHGAGRVMSRKKAKSVISLDEFKLTMNGIAADVGRHTLDEAPAAYKDLNEVIEPQRGVVVDIVDHVRPLVNVKG